MLKKFVPRKLQTLIRFYSIFNNEYGHGAQVNGFCANREGLPLPWITYPCLEFLELLDLSDCRVFEFGAGSSTLYWSRRAARISSVEREEDWYTKLLPNLPSNCDVRHCSNEYKYADVINAFDGQFDIIAIDGAVRYPCAETALKKLSARGLIILDNTEWYPNIAKLLRDQGFVQIDFSGFPPINAFTSCTSIFYKSDELLRRRREIPQWHPVGSRHLVAHDDKTLGEIDPATLRN